MTDEQQKTPRDQKWDDQFQFNRNLNLTSQEFRPSMMNYQNQNQIYQVQQCNHQTQPIFIQVITREQIEQPLLIEIEMLKNKIQKIQLENDKLYEKINYLTEQLQERQSYIDTYKQKYLDLQNTKEILLQELERVNSLKLYQENNFGLNYNKVQFQNNSYQQKDDNQNIDLEVDKLKIALINKDEEIRRLNEKYSQLETQGFAILEEKLKIINIEKESWKQKYEELKKNRQFSNLKFA